MAARHTASLSPLMSFLFNWKLLRLILLCVIFTNAQFHPITKPTYQRLPSLKDQAAIQDAWTKERMDYIPELMKKYGIDAWLVRFTALISSFYLIM